MKSMTGFGKATAEITDKKITVEARSLNSKQLDLNLRLPYLYREKEHELRLTVAKVLERGKVDISVNVEMKEAAKPVTINKELAISYFNELKSLSQSLGEEKQNLLPLLLKLPEVMQTEKAELSEQEFKIVEKTVLEAAASLDQFRQREGQQLSEELKRRIDKILDLLQHVETLDSQRVETVRSRIRKNIEEYVEKNKVDENRFEQEIIYYLEKIDITEEKVRLKMHCEYFIKTMNEPGAGRKLGFISQEIGREINTIGSKANDVTIQKAVVQMKDELEKVKEQLLNIL